MLRVLPFLLCALVLEVSSMWSMSTTGDESEHVKFGQSILERRLAGHSDQKMAISVLSYLPVRGAVAAGLELTGPASLFLARLPTVLASLVMLTLVFGWAGRLYGPRGALLSAGLYTVCPTILAHSGLATNDVFCALFTFAATMLFVRYLEVPTAGRLASCAAVTGLAQITKQTALLLLPIFAVLWTLDAVRAGASPGRARRLLAHGALGAVIVLVVVNASYLFQGTLIPVQAYLAGYRTLPPEIRDHPSLALPASLASASPNVPVPLPLAYLRALATGIFYNATGDGHGPNYLLGELSRMGWWYYFLVTLALKTPLAVILLFAAAAVLSFRWLRQDPLDESALLVAVVVILAFFSFASTAQIGIRYLLPMFPFLFVAVGKVAASAPRRHALAYHAGVVALVLWAAASSLSFHPHYLSYFNELIGDRKNMWRYLADSNVDWGQSDGDLARYLATQAPGSAAVNPPTPVGGRVIVNVSSLVGVTVPRERYAWLRNRFEPVAHIGYAWLVYEIPSE